MWYLYIHSIENTFVLCGLKFKISVFVAFERLQNIPIYIFIYKKTPTATTKQIQRLRMKKKKLNSFFFFYFLQSSIYLGNINITACAGGIVTAFVVGKTCIVYRKNN